ncbi:MAG TPA: hypothetical protein VFV08_13700 [Puia sp.]|nr:hypothetical protein [Puia sp.]
MPNYFNFLIYSNDETINYMRVGRQFKNVLSEGFRIALSSFSQGVNRQECRTGSIFQQNTRGKELDRKKYDLPKTCFHYLHQRAWKDKLAMSLEDWEFSSFRDYLDLRDGQLCNKGLAYQILNLERERFYEESYREIDPTLINLLF